MQPTPTVAVERLDAGEASLDALREAARRAPVPGLAPDAYASGRARFEERSDQRALIGAWLRDRLAARDAGRADGPVSVLSVGCGDGTLDVLLADALTRDPGRRVRYVGVEPFEGSAHAFTRRLRALGHPGLEVDVHIAPFDRAPVEPGFDVVTFVHSMYYVPDVAAAVGAAYRLLRPGGELLVLSAPRGALNQLAGVLAPVVEGHRQWFSDDVAAGFARAGHTVDDHRTLEAAVDLAGADDAVLDFTVQAALTPALRALVRTYLGAVAEPGTTMTVAHPVDTYRLTKPAVESVA